MVSYLASTPSIGMSLMALAFCSTKEKPKMPSALGLATSFWTIRLSFSPAST